MFKGENRKPEYLKNINVMGQVPAITDGDFALAESHAILRYLHTTRGGKDHWYPKDAKKRAQVDRYLDWHHTHLRHASSLIFKKCFAPQLTKKAANPVELASHEAILKRALKTMEAWLSESKFLCGDEMTIADLAASHELDTTRFL